MAKSPQLSRDDQVAIRKTRNIIASENMMVILPRCDDPDLTPGQRRTLGSIADALNHIDGQLLRLLEPDSQAGKAARRSR